jgi:hypothetical protein
MFSFPNFDRAGERFALESLGKERRRSQTFEDSTGDFICKTFFTYHDARPKCSNPPALSARVRPSRIKLNFPRAPVISPMRVTATPPTSDGRRATLRGLTVNSSSKSSPPLSVNASASFSLTFTDFRSGDRGARGLKRVRRLRQSTLWRACTRLDTRPTRRAALA